jgi:hypothetical protein
MINRFLYTLFVVLSVYFLVITNDISSAMTNLGLALVFDPFDQKVMWADRPMYQRAWLLIHVGVVFALFVWMLIG